MNFDHLTLRILRGIREGADVFSFETACILRNLERTHPDLLEVCEAMGEYADEDQQPYFGAILTDAGRAFLDALPQPEEVTP